MTRRFVLLAVAAQLLVLAWMAGEREWILRTGQSVYLRTAPIDPRDLFRGDFVHLQYEINSVKRDDSGSVAAAVDRPRHEVVYTRLRPSGDGLYEAVSAGASRPDGGVFLRGRIEDHWRMGWRGGNRQFVKYGIEQFFVEQGSGKAIEQRRGRRDDLQVPMEVEVAIGSSGTAVIRGYRWSRLGMKLEVTRRPAQRNRNAQVPPAPAEPQPPLSPRLRITLANTSAAPLALVDPGDHCAFHLVPVERAVEAFPPASASCSSGPATDANVITLAPDQTYSVDLDLSEPRWNVLAGGKPVEVGALSAAAQFRIEYRAPEAGAVPAGAKDVWRGRMASQAFNAIGVID